MTHWRTWLSARLLLPLMGLCAFCGLPPTGAVFGQALTPVEETMAQYLEETEDDAIALLERVVDINSGTMNHEGVRRVGEVFRAELDVLGFQTRWVAFPPEVNRAGQLFAERMGNGRGPKILMIGHLDRVFEKDSPLQSFQRSGYRASGPGAKNTSHLMPGCLLGAPMWPTMKRKPGARPSEKPT